MFASGEVRIQSGDVRLPGELIVPENAKGVILFSHGSGSSRTSPRNRFVAKKLQNAGFATLLLDLLTPLEDTSFASRFDIALLASRLADAIQFLRVSESVGRLPIGLFGASTGAASALTVAANMHMEISAVVSRGGRPDLAFDLQRVECPTLLIVGDLDEEVLKLNVQAMNMLPEKTPKHLAVVPGATHLFEEPGKLDDVAHLASEWFAGHLRQSICEEREHSRATCQKG